MSGILSAFFGGNYGAKPDAPTVGTATVTGTTTATLTFSAPAFDGGVTITSYTATSSPGGVTSTLNQSGGGTFNITGLSPGTAYTFSVTATNAIGTSASSGASNSITTYSVPVNTVAPVVSGTATYGQTLSTTTGTWTGVPASFSYAYQWQRAGSNIGGATGSTYQLVQADVGNAIRCVVTATNLGGSTAANSNATAAVVAVVPGAPQSVSATATSSSTANVSWSAPADNGGATITSYSIFWSGGSTTTGSTSVGIGGLSATTSYTFTVYAVNSVGTGPGTASNTITTPVPRGCATFTTPGNYTWYVPSGVSKISVGAMGPGGRGKGLYCRCGGTGGSIIAYNNASVGASHQVKVGAPSGCFRCSGSYFMFEGTLSSIWFCSYLWAPGGNTGGGGKGPQFKPGSLASYCSSRLKGSMPGNASGGCYYTCRGGGGGGAAGLRSPFWQTANNPSGQTAYETNCGATGSCAGYGQTASPPYSPSTNGRCGGGGGGGRGNANSRGGAGGGGTRSLIYGTGSGGGSAGSCCSPGGGGAGGDSGNARSGAVGGNGGFAGGGGGGGSNGGCCCYFNAGQGGGGMVRIIWPGCVRQFPNTCVYS